MKPYRRNISVVTAFLLIFAIGATMALDYKDKVSEPLMGRYNFNDSTDQRFSNFNTVLIRSGYDDFLVSIVEDAIENKS